MQMTYVVHILTGSLGLIFGYVALFAPKGAPLHRKSGMLLVYAVLTIPVLVPVFVMSYWFWRIRARKTLVAIVGASAPQATVIEAEPSR